MSSSPSPRYTLSENSTPNLQSSFSLGPTTFLSSKWEGPIGAGGWTNGAALASGFRDSADGAVFGATSSAGLFALSWTSRVSGKPQFSPDLFARKLEPLSSATTGRNGDVTSSSQLDLAGRESTRWTNFFGWPGLSAGRETLLTLVSPPLCLHLPKSLKSSGNGTGEVLGSFSIRERLTRPSAGRPRVGGNWLSTVSNGIGRS